MTESRIQTDPTQQGGIVSEAVTIRSIAIGLIVVVLSVAYITWALSLQASKLNKSYWPMGLFFVYALLVMLNAFLARSKSNWVLRKEELQVVLAMGLIGAFFPFFGLASFLVAVIATPFYMDTAENAWRDLLHEHIPSWIALHNEDRAATLFFEGLLPGESIPWGAWAIPMFWWSTLIFAIGWMTLCMMVILRKQWVENERLEYPLMNVGIQMASEADDPYGISQMMRNRGFRIGFGIGAIAVLWNVVSFFFPLVPQLPTTPTATGWFNWLDGAPTFWVRFSVYIVGFAYFARVEALFSVWLFFVITGIEVAVFDRLGVGSSIGEGGLEAVRSQSFGALIMIVLLSLWMSRSHLKDVFRKAIKGDPSLDDSGEVLSYRTAVIGFFIGLLYMSGWFHMAGMQLSVLALYVTFALIAYIGLTRIVAEVGLPYANISDTALNWAPFYVLGSRDLTAPSMVTQGYLNALFATTRGFLGPPLAQTLKLTSGVSFHRSRLVKAIILAMLVGMTFACADTIYKGYRLGGYNYITTFQFTQQNFQRAVTWIRNPYPTDWDRLTFVGVGMAVVAVLTTLRYHFIWWPLPAVGLAIQGMTMSRHLPLPVFAVWLYKTVILKIGGVQMYRSGQPFFIGMLIGNAIAVFISTVIDHFFFFGQGHTVHDY